MRIVQVFGTSSYFFINSRWHKQAKELGNFSYEEQNDNHAI